MASNPINPNVTPPIHGVVFTNPGSLKPRKGRSFKRAVRIEVVARLEAAMIGDAEIANHLGITVQAVYHIKNSPEYLAKRLTLMHGVLSKYDRESLATAEAQKEAVDELSQLALIQAKTILMDRSHAAHPKMIEVFLDRNPNTAKITKTQHSLDTSGNNFSAESKRARELVELLEGLGPAPELTSSPDPVAPIEFISERPQTTSNFILEMSAKAQEVSRLESSPTHDPLDELGDV